VIQWVYDKITIKYYTRGLRFFVSKLAKEFSEDKNWYKSNKVHPTSIQYHMALGQVISTEPDVKVLLKECKSCCILFITHPCNIKRDDLCCPFGCREIRKKENNNKRSKKYYQKHPERKRIRNQKRYLKKVQTNEMPEDKIAEDLIEVDEGVFISAKIFRYTCMVINTIEVQKICDEQILAHLRKKWRQHRLACSENCCRVRDG
jgi:hypothetical protein